MLSFLKIPVTIAHTQVKVKLDNFTSETYISYTYQKVQERYTAIHRSPTFKHLKHVPERSELLPPWQIPPLDRMTDTCKIITLPQLRWADTPRAYSPRSDTPPPKGRPLQRTVRILLECILVMYVSQKFCVENFHAP